MNNTDTAPTARNNRFQDHLTSGSMPMMILAVELPLVSIVAVNAAFSQLTGYTAEILLGRPFDFLFDAKRDRAVLATLYRAMAQSQPESAILHTRIRQGVPIFSELHLFPIRDDEGKLDCYRAILLPQPVTETSAAETVVSHDAADDAPRRRLRTNQEALAHLQFLHRTALELITLPDEDSIYTYIGEELSRLLAPAIVVINKVKDESHTVNQGIYGLDDSWLTYAAELLGYSPVGHVYPRHPQTETYFTHGNLVQFEGTLASWSSKTIPERVAKLLQKWTGLNNLYLIGLQKEGVLYADVQIYTRHQQTMPRPALIEAFIHQASTALQHMQAQTALLRAAANLRAVLDNLWQSFILVDRNYIVTDIGASGKVYAEAAVGQPIRSGIDVRNVIPEHHRDNFEANFQRALNGSTVTAESRNIEAAGTIRYHRLSYYPIADTKGEVLGVCLSHQEITAQKRNEAALQRTNRALRVLSKTIRVQRHSRTVADMLRSVCGVIVAEGDYQLAWTGVVVHDKAQRIRPLAHGGAPDGYLDALQLTWANTAQGQGPAGTAVRTCKPAVVRQIRTDTTFAPWREAAVNRGYESCIALPVVISGTVWGVLVIYAGSPDAFDKAEVELLKDLADDLAYGIGALHTQIERDRAVAALRESETSYRLLAENAPDVIYRVRLHPDMAFEYVSPAITAMTGYTPEDHYADPNLGYKLVHPDDRHILETVTHEIPAEPVVLRWVRKDGIAIWPEQQNVPIFDDTGKVVAIEGIARDITGRKQMETALRDSRQRIEMALQGTQAGAWEWHIPSGKTVFNERWAEIVGCTLAELMPTTIETWIDKTHPDDLRRSEALLQKHFAGELDYYECECRMRHKEGYWVWVLDRGRVTEWDASGAPVRMFGTHVDITRRKEAENALRTSETHYRLLAEQTTDLITRIAPDGHFTYVSPVSQSLVGYTPAELEGRSCFDLIHADDVTMAQKQLTRLVDTNAEIVTVTFRVRHKKDYYLWVETNSHLVTDPETGAPVAVNNVTRDVTRQRQAAGFMQGVLDSSLNGIMAFRAVRDAAGAIIDFEWRSANKAAEQLTGRTADSLIEKWLTIEMPGNREDGLFAAYASVVETGKPFAAEHYYEHEGMRAWFHISAVKLDDGFVVTFADITERKQAEAHVRFQAQLLKNVNDAIIAVDLSFNITYWNTGAERMYGWRAEEAVGQNSKMLFQSRFMQKMTVGAIAQQLREQGTWTGEAVHHHRNGRAIDVLMTRSQLVDSNGTVMGALFVNRDVTERKQAQQRELELTLEKERMQLLATFIQKAAHEFRTPLSTIGVTGHVMAQIKDGEKRLRQAKVIEIQVQRMAALVDQMLHMVRLESGEPFDEAPVDLGELLNAVTQNRAAVCAEDDGPELTVSADSALPKLRGDAAYLKKALAALLENACRFTPPDGKITVSAVHNAGEIQIDIRDTGPGIPESLQTRIFEAYWRQDSAHSTPGLGLGLPLARRIVERHGGTLAVESAVGEGSVFSLRLPISADSDSREFQSP